ncbi:MAG: hypothetical protein LQ351_000509 [Letrouitia transgressa]|nr:MAG: hypothetical protein LQ351_000509 [Letrouitia transgressa]
MDKSMPPPPPQPPSSGPTLPPVYPHPEPLRTLVPHLLPLLPRALPLVRRIQFQHSSSTALVLATFPPSQQPQQTTSPPPSLFAATYTDRARHPETESWLFSTYELAFPIGLPFPSPSHPGADSEWHAIPRPSPPQPPHHSSAKGEEREREDVAQARAQILALLHRASASASYSDSTQSVMVLGSLNECLLPLLTDPGDRFRRRGVVRRHSQPPTPTQQENAAEVDAYAYADADARLVPGGTGVLGSVGCRTAKWLLEPPPPSTSTSTSTLAEGSEELPQGYGYAFSGIRERDLGLCVARAGVPRSRGTLAGLGSVGVRVIDTADGEGELVAWAFLGTDGSLTSLHVEPQHRGRGLAKAVTRKLMRDMARQEGARRFRGSGGVEVVSSDIFVGNVESEGVVRALGGREGWMCCWVGADLGRLGQVVGRMGLGGQQEEER